MSAPKKIDAQTETQIVARLARGDTMKSIAEWVEEAKGTTISTQTISAIKTRNSEALDYMNKQLVQHETTVAAQILDKSRKLIDNKLNRALKVEDELSKLRREYENEEIETKEYFDRLEVIMRQEMSVKELNSLSKESFNQSQLEAGKPTSIAESPAQAKQNLAKLLTAIKGGDEADIINSLFIND